MQQLIGLVSGPLAGLCIALIGSPWATAFDAFSFLIAVYCGRAPVHELGVLGTCAVVGGLVGGASAGAGERCFGAGWLVIDGRATVGLCRLDTACSTSFVLTGGLMLLSCTGQVLANVAFGARKQALSPEAYRGPIRGISGDLAVLAVPPSTLLGGDLVGVGPICTCAGFWILIAGVSMFSQHIRTVRIGEA